MVVDPTRIRHRHPNEIHHEQRTVWGATRSGGTTSRVLLLDPFLAERQHIALFGPAKIGKTRLLQEAAGCLATGRPFLGRPTVHTRVLYLDKENDVEFEVENRLIKMGFDLDDLDDLVHISYPTLGHLDTEEGASNLLDVLAEYGCEVVVLDTASRFVEGEENSNTTWNRAYEHTGSALRQHGIGLIRIDHSGKDARKGARGASAKSADVDAVWRISKRSDGLLVLTCDATRALVPEDDKKLVIEAVDEPHLHHRIVSGGRAPSFEEKVAVIVDLLDNQGTPDRASVRKTQQMLWDLDVRVAKDVIAQAVKTRKERETPVLVTTDKENVEGEAAAEWADGFGEPDWDEQPPGLDWIDPNYEPDYDKSVPHLV